jgi:hypothetical protein
VGKRVCVCVLVRTLWCCLLCSLTSYEVCGPLISLSKGGKGGKAAGKPQPNCGKAEAAEAMG